MLAFPLSARKKATNAPLTHERNYPNQFEVFVVPLGACCPFVLSSSFPRSARRASEHNVCGKNRKKSSKQRHPPMSDTPQDVISLLTIHIQKGENLQDFFTRYESKVWEVMTKGLPNVGLEIHFRLLIGGLLLPTETQSELRHTVSDSPNILTAMQKISLYMGNRWVRFPNTLLSKSAPQAPPETLPAFPPGEFVLHRDTVSIPPPQWPVPGFPQPANPLSQEERPSGSVPRPPKKLRRDTQGK